MNQSAIIGLYHPQLMNRIGIAQVLNAALSNRVKFVDHLYDLFSATYSLIILIEPEILCKEYSYNLVSTFLEHITKPVIIVPFYEKTKTTTYENVVFTNINPTSDQLIECIDRIEKATQTSWATDNFF